MLLLSGVEGERTLRKPTYNKIVDHRAQAGSQDPVAICVGMQLIWKQPSIDCIVAGYGQTLSAIYIMNHIVLHCQSLKSQQHKFLKSAEIQMCADVAGLSSLLRPSSIGAGP
jgi:hypothetical protein